MYTLFGYQYMSVFDRKYGPKWKEMVLAPNNLMTGGKVGIDLVNAMLNTLWTLELANVSQLFTST